MVLTLTFDVASIEILSEAKQRVLEAQYGAGGGETNLSAWCRYVEKLFERSAWVDANATHLLRTKEILDGGLAVEIYCFSQTTDWVKHEQMRSALLAHLLLTSREYGLAIRRHKL